jgi:periplasmic protein TonB
MPAGASSFGAVGPGERFTAIVAVVLVQATLALALLSGLRVPVPRHAQVVERLIEIALPKVAPQPPPPPQPEPEREVRRQASPGPKAVTTRVGGTPGTSSGPALPTVTPIVAIQPSAAPSGGGSGTGPAIGTGAGGGAGGNGYGGSGEGGSDLEQIAGAILPSDYPRRLRRAGIGGRVEFAFTVGVNGRVTRCTVTRSSGVPELDELTCRLIQQRFRYRPSTDRFKRPFPDQVEGDHEWVSRSRY